MIERRNKKLKSITAITIEEIALRAAFADNKLPQRYRFPLTVVTTNHEFVFLAKTREDRDILMHEINNVCSV